MQCVFPVPSLTAIGEGIALGFHAAAQAFVTSAPPQLDKCLPFEGRSFATHAVVLLELIERRGPRSRIAVRTESQVNVKNAFVASLDEVDNEMSQGFEEVVVAAIVIHKHHLKIGRVPHFTPTELAQSQDGERVCWLPEF